MSLDAKNIPHYIDVLYNIRDIPLNQYFMLPLPGRDVWEMMRKKRDLWRELGSPRVNLDNSANDFIFVGPVLAGKVPSLMLEIGE